MCVCVTCASLFKQLPTSSTAIMIHHLTDQDFLLETPKEYLPSNDPMRLNLLGNTGNSFAHTTELSDDH